MGKHGQAIRARIKAFYERIKAGLRNETTLDWLKVLAPYVTIIVVLTGTFYEIHKFRLQREKEAVGRYLNIMRDLGDPSDTVRAAAAITMSTHLKENYDKYGKASIPVFVNQLAREPSPLVRSKILSILMSDEVKTDDLIKPFVSANRSLATQLSPSVIESYIKGEPLNENLLAINKALVEVIEKNLPEKLDLSNVFLVLHSEDINLKNAKLEGADLNHAILCRVDLTNAVLQGANLEDASLVAVILKNAELGGARLARANLASYDLRNAKFVKADLSHAILQDANMAEAILDKAYMYEADLTNTILEHASLRSANMTGARLELANLKVASLENANLSGADLSRADLTDANLASANLSGANLESANLEGADLGPALLFSIDSKFQSDLDKGTISKGLQQEFQDNEIQLANNATLSIQEKGTKYLISSNGKKYRISKEKENLNIYSDTILDFANLQEVDLTGALLTNASLQGATLTHANIVNATLQGADLFETDLTEANLVGANLTDANMVNATLQGADLFEADLTDANLAGADLKGANLESANLAGANLECADLSALLLFDVDSNKFQIDFDKRIISEDLRQEFEDNGIYLSKNTTVSIEEEDRRWMITDKGNEQKYIVRKEERLNICTEPNIVETELFSIDSNDTKKFQSDLDKATISEDLRQEFENNRIDLSQDTSISIEEKERTWLINEKEYGQTFTVRKEDGQLKIYERTKLDPTELFSVDSKKFESDLDKATISEYLRQELKNNRIDLSQTVSIKVKDKEWLINDKDYEQKYIVRKEDRLNICKETKFDLIDIKKAKNWQKAIFDDDTLQKLSVPQD